jgi:hypothetical protein
MLSPAIERAVVGNFLKRNDVLIPRFRKNVGLADWLWNVASPINGRPLNLFDVSTYATPELNPIELLWHLSVQ